MIILRKILCVILIISVTSCYSVTSISKEEFESNKAEYELYGFETFDAKYSIKDGDLTFDITNSGIAVRITTIKSRTIPISEISEFIKKENQLIGVKTKTLKSIYASDSLTFTTDRNGSIAKTISTKSKVISFDKIINYEYEKFNFIKTAFFSTGVFVLSMLVLGAIAMSGFAISG